MGSSGSKASSSSSSSSSSLGSFRKGPYSKTHRGFRSFCLGTTSGSHFSDYEDQVCDQNKKNERDVRYENGNRTESEEAKTESFRKVKSGEIPCMHSNINLDEWHRTSIPITASRVDSSSAHASSADSLNPSSRLLSRFRVIPGNISFRLSRATSLGSSRPCPVTSASITLFDDEDELNQQHPGTTGNMINRNEMPMQWHEDVSNNLRSNTTASGLSSNFQSNPMDGVGTREGLDLNLFSTGNFPESENSDTSHTDRRNGAQEPVEGNVHFSRALSVGRLRNRVFRRSTLSELTFCPSQHEEEVRDASQGTGRQVGEEDSRMSPSDHNSASITGYPTSSTTSSVFSFHDYEVETSRSRENRYQDLLQHRSNFLERRRRIQSQTLHHVLDSNQNYWCTFEMVQVRALQRMGNRFENHSGHDRSCILSGQQRNGRCACQISNRNANSNNETSAGASISRIVMLAEALFEVLDEIHQQSVVLSSRPSVSPLGSVPAPNEVVESLPVKLYTKLHNHQEDAAQCYICLVEYEDGDSIRVLPCNHEFHRTCVDKWLKEVHRVCPLCRGDICKSDSQPKENSSG